MSISTAATPLLQARQLGRRYRQGTLEVEALKGVDLDVMAGEFVALVGPSGSGKTTLLNLMGALDKPSEGSLRLAGQDIGLLPAKQAAHLRLHRIGFVFQDCNLLPVLSALENVEYVMLLQGVPASERRTRALDALQQLGLGDCTHRRPAQLSGGQQQRVAIARAIAARPLLVLADEPTAHLDSQTGALLMQLMRELNRRAGVTFVVSTHDHLVLDYACRVMRLKDGRLQADDRAGEGIGEAA